jgi:eukaryotic-like serine/threonine-protein kinase
VIDERWERVKELLHQAMLLAPEERNSFLDEACSGNSALRSEIESLLAADADAPANFLQSAAFPGAPDPDADGIGYVGILTPGQLFEERFQLVRKLGEGGMGQVWLADQISPVRRQVALKLIGAGMYDQAVVQRFQSERQSLAIMDHPCIAKVFDAGATAQGQPYFVMEYVPGLPITEYCDLKKLKIAERLELFIRACEGVQHAHQKAIIHRDLKPANILVVEVDGMPMPRIIDFGLAKPTAPRMADQTLYTQFGQFIGTPGYMSPEQVDPAIQDIDTRSDVYSLGVILYVLMTGMQPFETVRRRRPPLDEWLRKLREEDPPSLSAKVSANREGEAAAARSTEPKHLIRQLRGDLEWITMKALERDRERRYASPSELAADLKRHLNNEPVVARPATAAYQLRKFVRRHRLAAAVAGIVGVLAIIASGAGLIAVRKQHEAEFQKHQADYQRQQADYQAGQALQALSRLLTEAAAQRLKNGDVAGAQGVILDVLTNPKFPGQHSAAAISVFQEIRAADAQLAVLGGHGARVYSGAYSRDGTRIVTASADGTARIWDARTGAQLAVLSGHGDVVYDAAYSPDGLRIVTGSHDKTARIWDARTGAALAVLSGHGDRVDSAVYSPDGLRILTGSWDKTARIWDAHSGKELAVLLGHSDVVYSAAYSPDGKRIVTASQDKTARIWDALSGKQLAVLAGHGDYVADAAYSPDGSRIVTASADKTARIWDALSGKQLAVLSGHGEVVYGAGFSPDGRRIVTASWDKTARIWDAHSGAELAVLSGHGATIASAAYSPDGARIVTASQDQTARVWDARVGAQLAVLSGHGDAVYSAAYSPDGTRIVTASYDKTGRIWDALNDAEVAMLSGHGGSVASAAYSPDGARIVTASQDKSARIWDARTGSELAVLDGHADRVFSAAYSPDGTRIVTASRDKTARIWDARSAAPLTVLSGHGDRVYSAAYSPDGMRIVTASRDKTARIWDALSGAQIAVLSGHGGQVLTAAYSADGSRIVTASEDETARIWNARTGGELAVLSGHGGTVTAAAYSPDGKRIVTASQDKTARVWDARSGLELAVLAGHTDSVYTAVYAPDGGRIVTASEDRTARIWDAGIPADIGAQILWDASAQADALPEIERTQLGLPPDVRVRTWPAPGSACDQAAAAAYDPERVTRGVPFEKIAVEIALPACTAESSQSGAAARSDYELGRALLANGDAAGAARHFERAMGKGYRAARVDLADLKMAGPAQPLQVGSAVALYEQAWRDGVPIAAFRLGSLYERALPTPDTAQALRWYAQGAAAGEPNALARFAEREERSALGEADERKRHALLLEAFTRYAAAAERARLEDWPDEAWKYWRYRRATLARLLAQEGMMPEVADAYAAVLKAWTPAAGHVPVGRDL